MKEFRGFNRAWQPALLSCRLFRERGFEGPVVSVCFSSSALLSATTAESSGCGEVSELVA